MRFPYQISLLSPAYAEPHGFEAVEECGRVLRRIPPKIPKGPRLESRGAPLPCSGSQAGCFDVSPALAANSNFRRSGRYLLLPSRPRSQPPWNLYFPEEIESHAGLHPGLVHALVFV
jgi:hypothetical protein